VTDDQDRPLGLAHRAMRRLVQKFGRRWSDQALLAEVESLRTRIDNLSLVRSAAELDGEFACAMPGSGEQRRLYRSRFTMAWADEFGVAPRVIFDIGAYDGGDSIRFKQKFSGARVVSFEADPDRYAVVAGNVRPFGGEPVNAAICDRDGPVTWYQSHDGRFADAKTGSQGSLYRHSAAFARRFDFIRQSNTPITVEGFRIDTFCRGAGIDEIDIAHIDVEGAEYEVVAGFGAILPKLIYVEAAPFDFWIGARHPRELHQKLSSLGYLIALDLANDRLYVRADLLRCRS